MITELEIRNFKAIREGKVRLTPIHLLIGANDTGKTTILEALAAICRSVFRPASESFLGRWQGWDLVHKPKSKVVNSRGISLRIFSDSDGVKNLYEVIPEFRNETVRWQKRHMLKSTRDQQGDRDLGSIEFGSDPIIEIPDELKFSTYDDSGDGLSVIDLVNTCWYLRWNARMLALPVALNPKRSFRVEQNGFGLATLLDDLLNYDRELFAQLEQQFIDYFPNVRSIALQQQPGYDAAVDRPDEILDLKPAPGKQIVFRMKNADHDLPASQAAEGMLYLLGYLALLHLPHPPRVLLIEEPENGIHPRRVGDIVRILRLLVDKHPETQIVLTSHSPYLVDEFQPEEVTLCRRDSASGDVVLTRLDEIPEVKRSLKIFSLGEIWTGELEPGTAPVEEVHE